MIGKLKAKGAGTGESTWEQGLSLKEFKELLKSRIQTMKIIPLFDGGGMIFLDWREADIFACGCQGAHQCEKEAENVQNI